MLHPELARSDAPLPRPGDRVRLIPGCRTSAGTAGAHDVGTVAGRIGQSTIFAVRLPGSPSELLVEYRNLVPMERHIPLRTLLDSAGLDELTLRSLWGDR